MGGSTFHITFQIICFALHSRQTHNISDSVSFIFLLQLIAVLSTFSINIFVSMCLVY